MVRIQRHALSGALAFFRNSGAPGHLRRGGLAGLALLFLLAACTPLPRPFQPDTKTANPLTGIKDGELLHVLPITRQAPGDPYWIAMTLADALRSRNLPATIQHPGPRAKRLSGRAVVRDLGAGREEVLFYWEVNTAQGERLAAHSQRGLLPKGAWRAGDKEAIAPLLEETAAAVAKLVQSPNEKQRDLPGFPGARLVILPILSAPGDGNLRLAQALAEELGKAGLPLASHPGARDLLIDCQVTLGPTGGYWREIKLTWAVNNARNGQELGRIDQSNRVPAEQLEGSWGPLSSAIAQGAAAGILDLLDQVGGNSS